MKVTFTCLCNTEIATVIFFTDNQSYNFNLDAIFKKKTTVHLGINLTRSNYSTSLVVSFVMVGN